MTEEQDKKFNKALDESWRNAAQEKSLEELNASIRDCAVALVELEIMKETDADLARIKEELAAASEQYKVGKKENGLRIQYMVQVLKDRGVDVAGFSTKKILAEASKRQMAQHEANSAESHASVNNLVEAAGGMTISVTSGGKTVTLTKAAKKKVDEGLNDDAE